MPLHKPGKSPFTCFAEFFIIVNSSLFLASESNHSVTNQIKKLHTNLVMTGAWQNSKNV
jgi:hypothetical protein